MNFWDWYLAVGVAAVVACAVKDAFFPAGCDRCCDCKECDD